jgi:hypothetical protein
VARSLIALLLALSVGCAASSAKGRGDAARAQAVRDLPCPAESIEVTHLSRDLYRAEGCGKTEIYTCRIAVNGTLSCLR